MNNKYHSKLKKIKLPEIMGSIVCLAAAVFIGFSFDKLDSLFLRGAGILSFLLLLALPIISLQSTQQLSKVGDLKKPYAETLKEFALGKIRFIRLQKLNVTLSYLLLVAMIVLLPRLFANRDISNNKYYWIFSFSFGYIFLVFYSKYVMRRYRETLQQSEELLKEIVSLEQTTTANK